MIRAILLSTLLATPALAQPACIDTELVLLADVSISMSSNARELQREGYADAFRNGAILDQISAGACGAIAVQYVEFAEEQEIIADWTIIATDEDAAAFAQAIETAEPADAGELTNISAAMQFAADQILSNGLDANWRVVDVSSDGTTTKGEHPALVRDQYTKGPVWEQIAFNGLPLTRRGMMNDQLREYFRAQIVGGPRSFLSEPVDLQGLGNAIIRKLQEEIG